MAEYRHPFAIVQKEGDDRRVDQQQALEDLRECLRMKSSVGL
jgi:hypothetical protein